MYLAVPLPTENDGGGDTPTSDDSEQYKRKTYLSDQFVNRCFFFSIKGLSVKERARMLTTTIPPMDKKTGSPSNSTGK